MKTITAEVMDATHLELSQPIQLPTGNRIRISVPESEEEERLWKKRGKAHLLNAYVEEDALYDELLVWQHRLDLLPAVQGTLTQKTASGGDTGHR